MLFLRPNLKPNNPNFSSGPTAKRPNWSLSNLESATLGRSHRAKECKDKVNEVILRSKKILAIKLFYFRDSAPKE